MYSHLKSLLEHNIFKQLVLHYASKNVEQKLLQWHIQETVGHLKVISMQELTLQVLTVHQQFS